MNITKLLRLPEAIPCDKRMHYIIGSVFTAILLCTPLSMFAVPSDKYMKGHINIPSMYYKIFMYNNIKECFKIPNDNKSYKLKDMKIKCNLIKIRGL